MTEFPDSITTFLEDRGFKVELCNTQGSLLLFVRKDGLGHIILPYPINACTAEDANSRCDAAIERSGNNCRPR